MSSIGLEGKKPVPDPSNVSVELSPVKRALHEIRALRARLEQLEAAQHEPIAIIGTGIRFPGNVADEASFWNLLADKKDAITEIPQERWDWRAYFNPDADAPGAMYTQHGGFLDGVDLFDSAFFGISPREAASMDPQHRLVLEVGWEALENAGYSPATLEQSLTGVFLGIANNDYGRSALGDVEHIDAYTGSGNSPAMVAGRLSYVFGLHGPSLAIDTSCSSSLVSIHLACLSLRAAECKVALAGGVNLILSPESNIALSKAHMMARDGRCKTFDEAADGYVRSEGCCVIVLKRLAEAISDGDRIMAVIRGSAVNHDGRSGGLTAPNGPAQAAVIRQALEFAKVDANEIGYLETHGTGTALGDPIEVETLASMMGKSRLPESPLAIGSVKTNIGHTEAASGIAGLMKTVLALQHHEIPASLHLKHKNSHIDWDRLPLVVPVNTTEWNPINGHRYAGVSSFGFSGTNAHVVLEEAPKRELVADANERPMHVLALSAKSRSSLDRLRAKYTAALRNSADALPDICFTANSGRAHFAHRIAAVATNAEEMAMHLEQIGNGDASARVFSGVFEQGAVGRLGFLYTGQGSQYAGMGEELYAGCGVFREAIEGCARAWQGETGESLTEGMYGGGESRMGEARYAQPALFAFEYALSEVWRSWGVEPGVVLGHSLGEYVAAVVAGVFSMEDGMRLVCARARLMDSLAERGSRAGAMRSIGASVERVSRELAGWEGEVALAAINGAESVVISGEAERVRRIAEKLEGEGIRTRGLEVTHGFHSPLLEPILEEFEECARQVKYQEPRIRIISNLTGKPAAAGEMGSARYWRQHMRHTVQFHAGLHSMLAAGCHTLLEIGPQPHLKALAVRTDESLESRILISMRRQRGAWDQMLETLAKFYVQGHKIDWHGFDKGRHRVRVALPTYCFERQRHRSGATDAESAQRLWQAGFAAARSQSEMAPIGMRVESFAAKWESLKRLTIAEMVRTLRELGCFGAGAASHSAESVIAECSIAPAHSRLIGRWLNLLSEAGYLEKDHSEFHSRAPLPDVDIANAWREAEMCLGDEPFLLEYVRNCSRNLRGVLLGTTSPLETLFPGGSPELAKNLYEKSSGARYANLIVAAILRAACLVAPASRRLRILEIGGGTGATTAAILPVLAADRVSYRFTDVSEVFLQKASARFSQYSFVRYGLLDLENEAHIALYRGSFDIVVAANVVHATRNVQATLSGVQSMLAPGGMVVLLETTQTHAWHDITTGLIEGWQKSEEDIRVDSPLLSAREWLSTLRQAGFEKAVSVPELGSPAEDIGLHVIMASRPFDQSSAAGYSTSTPSITGAEAFWQQSQNLNPVNDSAFEILLQETPPAEWRSVLLHAVGEEIARVLGLPANATPKKHDRLMDLGVDSLMAIEISNRLVSRVGLKSVTATLIFDYPTPDAIAGYLLQCIENKQVAERDFVQMEPLERILTAQEVGDLSEEDVADLLRSRLAQ